MVSNFLSCAKLHILVLFRMAYIREVMYIFIKCWQPGEAKKGLPCL